MVKSKGADWVHRLTQTSYAVHVDRCLAAYLTAEYIYSGLCLLRLTAYPDDIPRRVGFGFANTQLVDEELGSNRM